jgi:hypothetical protein
MIDFLTHAITFLAFWFTASVVAAGVWSFLYEIGVLERTE